MYCAVSAVEIEEQHPIPQQVSAYQFKLVGDMTLQQFFQVAGGALVALLFYSSSLPSYVKWPLILISFLIGIALAFFPLEDRPLAKWIVLFAKAIYSPTLYVWKQTPAKFSYFQKEPTTDVKTPEIQPPVKTTTAPQESEKLEVQEIKFLEKVSKDLTSPPQQTIPPKVVSTPQTPVTKTSEEGIKDTQVPIPKKETVSVEKTEKPKIEPFTPVQEPVQRQAIKLTPSTGQVVQDSQNAKFSPDAAPPTPPTKPNVIVGQVVGPEGSIIESAILEIRDSEGRPVRALKSNKLGHFMIVTPLTNGNYQITTEKEGFVFDTIKLEAKGEIIPSIAIWAKGKTNTQTPEPIKT